MTTVKFFSKFAHGELFIFTRINSVFLLFCFLGIFLMESPMQLYNRVTFSQIVILIHGGKKKKGKTRRLFNCSHQYLVMNAKKNRIKKFR